MGHLPTPVEFIQTSDPWELVNFALRASPSVARISRETVDGSDIGSRISAEGPMVTVLSRRRKMEFTGYIQDGAPQLQVGL